MFTNTSRPSAVDVLRPFVIGDTFYADTTTTLAKRAIGSTNDVLIVSGGVPVWSSAVVLTSLSVVDSGFFVVGSADATKRLNFEVDAQTAGDTLTINTGAQTDSRTATFPVLTGNSILALSNSTLTATRIPFATTNGILTDSANLTFASATGVITHTGTAPQHLIVVPAATNQNIFSVGGSTTGAAFCNYTNTSGSFLMGINGSAGGFLGAASTAYATSLCSFTATHLELGSNATIRLRIQDTGEVVGLLATDATSSSTGAWQVTGGANIAKNLLHRQGRGAGVTSTTTAAGTTTLTSASTEIQTFVGSTTQTVQFPAANLFGAGIAVCFTINNQSSGTVTPTRAGADVFQGGGTTDPVLAGASTSYRSNGVSVWLKV